MVTRPPSQPPRESIAPDELAAYDRIIARSQKMQMPGAANRSAGPYWGALLNAPPVAFGLAEMGPDPSNADVDRLLDGYRRKATPLPDPKMRIA
jgi:hypothetical protein